MNWADIAAKLPNWLVAAALVTATSTMIYAAQSKECFQYFGFTFGDCRGGDIDEEIRRIKAELGQLREATRIVYAWNGKCPKLTHRDGGKALIGVSSGRKGEINNF